MALTFNNPNVTPPGLYRYRIPELTGEAATVKDFYAYNDLENEVIARYKRNGIGIPSDLRQQITDQLCQQLPKGWCRDGTGLFGYFRTLLHEFQRVLQGTITLADWWIAAGKKRVSTEEIQRRSAICQQCAFNQPPTGCSGCNMAALNRIIEAAVGNDRLPSDAGLEACAVCGCSLKVKTRLPLDVLQRHLTDEQKMQFPPAHNGWPGCWLREKNHHENSSTH
jgi:hypothetical protein